MKKTLVLSLFIFLLSFSKMTAQNKVIVKLNRSQIENMATSKKGERVSVRFRDNELDDLFARFQFTAVYQSFPEAKFFKHPASERVAQYYTLEGNFDLDHLTREFQGSILLNL